jgi:hypothetical protein
MATPEQREVKPVPTHGINIEVTLADRNLAPRFEPVIKKIADIVQELTGTVCTQEVAAKLRW